MNLPRHPAKRSFWGSWIALVFLGLSLLMLLVNAQDGMGAVSAIYGGLMLILVGRVVFTYYSTLYLFEDGKIRSNEGIISRNVISASLKDVREVNVTQSIMGRILGYGTVTFDTAAGINKAVEWFNVRQPMEVREYFEDLSRSGKGNADTELHHTDSG